MHTRQYEQRRRLQMTASAMMRRSGVSTIQRFPERDSCHTVWPVRMRGVPSRVVRALNRVVSACAMKSLPSAGEWSVFVVVARREVCTAAQALACASDAPKSSRVPYSTHQRNAGAVKPSCCNQASAVSVSSASTARRPRGRAARCRGPPAFPMTHRARYPEHATGAPFGDPFIEPRKLRPVGRADRIERFESFMPASVLPETLLRRVTQRALVPLALFTQHTEFTEEAPHMDRIGRRHGHIVSAPWCARLWRSGQ